MDVHLECIQGRGTEKILVWVRIDMAKLSKFVSALWRSFKSIWWIFLKSASRLLPNGWVELKISGYRCNFRAFQLELDNLGTVPRALKLRSSVVKKLWSFVVGWFLKILGKS